MSNYILIDTKTGTVTSMNDTVFVDFDSLSAEDQAILSDDASDSEIIAVANKVGTPLGTTLARCGFGDLHYGNAIAYSPEAIKDELGCRKEAYEELVQEDDSDDSKQLLQIVEWALSLSNDDLADVAELVLNGDDAWNDYMVNILEALAFMYANHHDITETETN